jgi:hypothetical protein
MAQWLAKAAYAVFEAAQARLARNELLRVESR